MKYLQVNDIFFVSEVIIFILLMRAKNEAGTYRYSAI